MHQIRTISFTNVVLTIICAVVLLLAAAPQLSAAANFAGLTVTVDYWGDQSDTNPGNGVCLTSGGYCTLRAAIEEINAYNVSNPGTHNIHFGWASNPLNILPGSPLPVITAPVIIDGTTQTGSSCPSGVNTPATLNVILNGTAAGVLADGLTFGTGSDGSVVKGLVINNFDDNGIFFEVGVDNISIQCNHIGTNSAGNMAAPNENGIHTYNNENLMIGGSVYAARNVISGNEFNGIRSSNTITDNSFVMGNFIGTDATGTTAVPNGQSGVALIGSNNQIGGAGPAERNIISGNLRNGISISSWSNDWTIINNYIGVDVFGTTPLGNGYNGIDFEKGIICCAPSGNVVGWDGFGNVIANNGRAGIHVEGDSTGTNPYPDDNSFRYNSIYNNGGLGIDLSFATAGDGVTANDGLSDPDDGPNTLLNFPVLSDANTDGVDVTVTFDYAGDAGSYMVSYYVNDSCDPSGYGEGQSYVHTDGFFTGSGNYNNTITFPTSGAAGKYLTSVATYGDNSSEFSACVTIADSTQFVVNSDGDGGDFNAGDGRCDTDNNSGNGDQCTLRAAIEQANAFSSSVGPINVTFDISSGSGPHSIELGSALPVITHPILLDATTQPGAKCAADKVTPAQIQVIINGGGLATDGITLGAGSDGSLIRGFSFFKFDGDAIQIDSDFNVVQCNHIGTDYTGTSAGNIVGSGVHISGENNLIGGTFDTLRNLISANGSHGILLDASTRHNNIYGNIIGLEVNALDPLGNGGSGVYVNGGDHNNIGAPNAMLGNIISANSVAGIFMNLDSDNNDVYSNKIGTDIEGNHNRGNAAQGIYGERSDDNNIGSSIFGGVGNLIADNGTYGIRFTNNSTGNEIRFNDVIDNGNVAISIANSDDQLITNNTVTDNAAAGIAIVDGGGNATGNEISQNSIYDNNGLGIDLEGDGVVEPNDSLDVDGGPNMRQNFPILDFVTGGDTIYGDYYSHANKDFTLEFFSSDSCDSSGHGEGKQFLGSKVVTTDGSGHVDFIAGISGSVTNGEVVTAVATDNLTKNSSEFSACLTVCDNSNPLLPTIDIDSNSVELAWSVDPTALQYIIYRSVNQPYNAITFYEAVNHPTNTWIDGDSDEIGDVDNNYYYAVAVDRVCGVSVSSKTMGEFDFAIVAGTP